MPEVSRPKHESGETVATIDELIESIMGQPAGYYLMISAYWADYMKIRDEVVKRAGQNLLVAVCRIFAHEGKQACLMKIEVPNLRK